MNKSKESRLRRLEQQLADPRLDNLEKLARLLGVSVDDLPPRPDLVIAGWASKSPVSEHSTPLASERI